MIALLPTMIQTSVVGTRITAARNKKTWDTFLTTPVSGREILWSKSRVGLTSLKTGWPLLVIWALGLACGVVTPLGVPVTALDLVLLTWAFASTRGWADRGLLGNHNNTETHYLLGTAARAMPIRHVGSSSLHDCSNFVASRVRPCCFSNMARGFQRFLGSGPGNDIGLQ
jgi:hypothetical protein